MGRFRETSRSLAAWGLAIALAIAPGASAIAQPALQRTPNVEGPWVTPGGTMFFDYAHRFKVGAAPTYAVDNIPSFHLSGGFFDWLSVGALYATQTATVAGASQELELWGKQRFINEADGAPVSLSLKEAFNVTAMSPDAELSASRRFGPIGLTGAVRAMGNYRYTGSPRAVGAIGLSWTLTPYLALAGDVAASPMQTAAEPPVIWGGGLQMMIPGSPHTLSLQVTNTGTDTLQGSSTGLNELRWGFDFTIPLVNAQQWLDIFRPGAAAPAAPGRSGGGGGGKAQTKVGGFDAAKFFGANCASCHGAAGQGGFGPNLTGVDAKGDAFIANRITKGSPKGMPPFEGRLTADELKALVGFVKGL